MLIKLSEFNYDINDTIRTADEFLDSILEKQRMADQIEKNKFIISLQDAIREGINLSKESFRNAGW